MRWGGGEVGGGSEGEEAHTTRMYPVLFSSVQSKA